MYNNGINIESDPLNPLRRKILALESERNNLYKQNSIKHLFKTLSIFSFPLCNGLPSTIPNQDRERTIHNKIAALKVELKKAEESQASRYALEEPRTLNLS